MLVKLINHVSGNIILQQPNMVRKKFVLKIDECIRSQKIHLNKK